MCYFGFLNCVIKFFDVLDELTSCVFRETELVWVHATVIRMKRPNHSVKYKWRQYILPKTSELLTTARPRNPEKRHDPTNSAV
jgi:hypothetical protein